MTLTPEDIKYLEPEFQKLAELEQEAGILSVEYRGTESDSLYLVELVRQAKPLLTALIAERKRVEELEEAVLAYAPHKKTREEKLEFIKFMSTYYTDPMRRGDANNGLLKRLYAVLIKSEGAN